MPRSGGHLGLPIDTKNTYLVKDHPLNILAKFTVKQFTGFRK